jgi:glycosyltransferase involved in cell wall biosynthesis
MAVHNGSPFLRTAIESILQQTYSNFLFLIIDDASTDDSVEIVRSYDDARIQSVCLEKNVGQTAALNIGLGHITTPWIARMDADDYSASTRFEKQMQALEADSSLSCLGTHIWIFHDDPRVIEGEFLTPLEHTDIKRALLRGSPIVHGSMIVRRDAIVEVGGYDDRYREAADMELYDRLLAKHIASNIPEKLVGVRHHGNQGSRSILALDEVISIFSGRLATDHYSRKEAAIIRATISRAYVYRSRSGLNFREQLGDLGRAVRFSPNTFLWNLCLVFVFNRFSSNPRRAKFRSILARSAPKFLTGR